MLIATTLRVSFQPWQPAPPRCIFIASGVEHGLYHRYAQRYKEVLAREGVTIEERVTAGAGATLSSPRAPASKGFIQRSRTTGRVLLPVSGSGLGVDF